MHIFIVIVLLLVGLALIIIGGQFFVDSATWIAEVSGIPKIIIGATIVSVATTLPELLVSVMAAVEGKVDISIGNAIGSVTANLGLIMAIGLICIPAAIRRKEYAFKAVLMLAAAAIIIIVGWQGSVGTAVSVILLVMFAAFMVENVISAKKSHGEAVVSEVMPIPVHKDRKTVIINILKFAAGAAGIVFGADFLVNNGSELARIIGISERVIGVTLVAVGTSLPELVTTITAIAKKQASLSVGNILGANIIDLTLIMPLSSVISGKALPVAAATAAVDFPACLIIGAVAVIPALIFSRFRKWQGFLMLAIYVVYLIITCTKV